MYICMAPNSAPGAQFEVCVFLSALNEPTRTVHVNTAIGQTTKTPLVCGRPAVTHDGVIYIRALVVPNKSSITAPTYTIDIKST